MKKILSVFLAVIMPLMMFTSCKEEPTAVSTTKNTIPHGIYLMTSDDIFPCKIQFRDEMVVIEYNSNMSREPGKYEITEDTLRVMSEKNGSEYVFNIRDGKLYYDAANSKPSENFLKESGVVDGSEFYLSQTLQQK